MKNKNKYEVVIYGRGGQGAKTSAEMLVQAAVQEGKFVQAFPEFGPERSGAPVKSFVRISDFPIKTHEPVIDPDCILVLDDTLIEELDLTNLTGKEPLILNTKKLKKDFKNTIISGVNFLPVDASGIALEIIGEDRPNTVILGRFCFVTELIDVDNLKKVFRVKYEKKIGISQTKKSLLAIDKAYHIY